MSVDRIPLLRAITAPLTTQVSGQGTTNSDRAPEHRSVIVIHDLAASALHHFMTGADTPPSRAELEALCRQIDVRKKIARSYDQGFVKQSHEENAEPCVVVAVVALLLCAARHEQSTADPDGRGIKYVNSALKALEFGTTTHSAALRAWAVEMLDIHATRGTTC